MSQSAKSFSVAALWAFVVRVVRESLGLYWSLIKIMVPVMVVVKIAVDLGLVDILSRGFAPLMTLVGLPAEMGLVWATAVLVNMYGGAAALIGVLPDVPMTGAQITIILSMILFCHAIPLEQRICQKAGASLLFTSALRFGVALAYGMLMNAFYAGFDLLQEPVSIAWLPSTPVDAGWLVWAENAVVSLASIFVIIVALIFLLRLLDVSGATRRLSALLSPMLSVMGISPTATPLAMVGVLLGLSYGGGLIIKEAKAGHMSPRDIVLSLSLLAICHSLIEDTLFMIALGGHWSGVLVFRVIFSVLVMIALARIVAALPERVLMRWLFVGPKPVVQPAE